MVLGLVLAATVMGACAPAAGRGTPAAERAGPVYPTAVVGDGSAAPSAESPGRDDHDHDAPVVPPQAQAMPVAAAFAAAWAQSDLPAAAWWRGVAASCDEDFARSLRTVDPSRVPASRVTGRPVVKQAPQGGKAVFAVPTDVGTLTVWLAGVNGRWVVTDNDFRRAVAQ